MCAHDVIRYQKIFPTALTVDRLNMHFIAKLFSVRLPYLLDATQPLNFFYGCLRTHCTRKVGAYAVCGPTIWNSLPKTLRLTDNFAHFRRLLKTHLFNLAFN